MLERTIADVIGYLRQSLRRLPLPLFPATRFNTIDGIRRLFKLCRYSGADIGTWGHAQWRYLAGRRRALDATMRAAPGAIGQGDERSAGRPVPLEPAPYLLRAGRRGRPRRGPRMPPPCPLRLPAAPARPGILPPPAAAPGACGRHGCAHTCTRAPPAPGAAGCLHHDPGSAHRSARRGARRPQHGARPRPGALADPFIRRLRPPPGGGTAWRSWGGA